MHISFVMDGNGRWAKKRGLPRVVGHRQGAKTLVAVMNALGKFGIEEATFYAFSTENWNRPADEVAELGRLLEEYLKTQVKEVHRQNGVFKMIGSRRGLSEKVLVLIDDAEALTAKNTGIRMNIAYNYGSRMEIADACREIAAEAVRGDISVEDIDEKMVGEHLYLSSEPDLMIRTGREKRLSNYLLWQHSYSELIFLDTLWPDFDEAALAAAIDEFKKRDRRFGGL